MSRRLAPTLALLLLTLLTAYSAAEKPQWPQWRGPDRDGRVAGDKWPDRIDEKHFQELWKTDLGPSYSGPIVADGLVFTTATVDQAREVVKAFQADSGELVWETSWKGAMKVPFFAASNGSWIRSTPAWDDHRLYVAGMRDVLVCLDARTGKTIWKADFVEQLKTALPSFGFVCSPLVWKDHVYVQAGGAFLKLDKKTGKLVWRSLADKGGMWGSAFSSPVAVELGGKPQLLVQTRQELAGVDPEDGKKLWSEKIKAFRGMNILTPTVYDGGIFTSSYGGGSLMLKVDAENSWKTSRPWEKNTQGYMSSPVVVDGHAYLHLRNQRFTCIDLKTGEVKWTTSPFGKYWSMAVQGKRMLALDERGDLLLIQANPEKFELVDRRKISDQPSWAHIAVAGDTVYVRGLKRLTAYRWKAK